jgi:hypothetical protein
MGYKRGKWEIKGENKGKIGKNLGKKGGIGVGKTMCREREKI